MDKLLKQPGPSRPFEMPSHFDLWVVCEDAFPPLKVFKVLMQCDGLHRELSSKAFNPTKADEVARAWLEFMSLTGNIIITTVMPPDMLARFRPTQGGGMQLLGTEGEEEDA